MKTTQTAIARLESGRVKPSTRTLQRLAKATGHRLVIDFKPIAAEKSPRAPARPQARQSAKSPCRRDNRKAA
jgi:transcriptional regulator with XRE-family HTH domain